MRWRRPLQSSSSRQFVSALWIPPLDLFFTNNFGGVGASRTPRRTPAAEKRSGGQQQQGEAITQRIERPHAIEQRAEPACREHRSGCTQKNADDGETQALAKHQAQHIARTRA